MLVEQQRAQGQAAEAQSKQLQAESDLHTLQAAFDDLVPLALGSSTMAILLRNATTSTTTTTNTIPVPRSAPSDLVYWLLMSPFDARESRFASNI